MRAPQPEGTRGSLKWIQRAVERRPDLIQPPGLAEPVDWRSPRQADDWAEYRDAAFLDCLDLSHLTVALTDFWPSRGPQWDALGVAGECVLLVEAKAHIAEFLSPPSKASARSLAQIRTAFAKVQEVDGIDPPSDWARCFYQLANRLAHLSFLRKSGVDARLMLLGFIGDADMGGPDVPETWHAAEAAAFHALGIAKNHPLRRSVISLHPDVAALR